jgi:hypothetical protein
MAHGFTLPSSRLRTRNHQDAPAHSPARDRRVTWQVVGGTAFNETDGVRVTRHGRNTVRYDVKGRYLDLTLESNHPEASSVHQRGASLDADWRAVHFRRASRRETTPYGRSPSPGIFADRFRPEFIDLKRLAFRRVTYHERCVRNPVDG